MALLAEAISIVVKISSLHAKYPGGWETFRRDCPNRTLASDGELARIGIMDPRPVRELVNRLKAAGLALAGAPTRACGPRR